MEPKIISISELITKSRPLSGALSLNPKPSPFQQKHQRPSNPTPTDHQNPNAKTLPSLNYPTLIIGTLNLPSDPNCSSNLKPCNCFSFSDDSSQICCAVLDGPDVIKMIGKQIHLLSWNFIPFICGGSGLLEIISWSLEDSVTTITRCSNINAFPCDLSSRDENLETRSRALGRLESVSPVSVVPCTRKDRDSHKGSGHKSNSSGNVRGFLAELLVCGCILCRSKASITTLCNSLGEETSHLFNDPVVVYFFQSASTWHPLLSKLLGKLVCITGLKKKQIFFGKDDSCLMFITTEKLTVFMPLLAPICCPFQKKEMKWMGETGAYTGIVTGIYMQGMAVELDGKVWLLLTDQALAPPHSIRVGALICARNVHFISPRFSWTRTLLLGACFKASINVKFFSPLDSQCHTRFQTQSMLGKFIDSLVFSARFWLLLTISSFKKILASFFTEKEILGSKHKEGLAQMYARLHLPSCAFQPRHGVFMEFCNHGVCGCGNEPDYSNLKLVVPLSSFISHCETMWVNSLLQMQDDRDPVKNNLYWCDGKSYYRLIRRIMSSEDLGVVLMGTLKW